MDWINCEFIGPPPKGYDSWLTYMVRSKDKIEELIIKAKEPEFVPERFKIELKQLASLMYECIPHDDVAWEYFKLLSDRLGMEKWGKTLSPLNVNVSNFGKED